MRAFHIANRKPADVIKRQVAKYKKQIRANDKAIDAHRTKRMSLDNKRQYLRRCVQALETELGHVKAGQLSFNMNEVEKND